MAAGYRYIRQDVSDISSADQLVRYAVAGQLAQLLRRRSDLSDSKIAYGAGLGGNPRHAGSVLSKALRSEIIVSQLVKLDEIIGALAPELERTGGLCSLDLRLAAQPRKAIRGSMFAHVPPGWSREILKEATPNELGVLVQASALLSEFLAVQKMDSSTGRNVADVRYRYQQELGTLVRRLILISVGPPAPKNIDAQIILGILASYAFEPMKQLLDRELRASPLGFRVWRAITELVKLSPEEGDHANVLRPWVRQLIRDSEGLRKRSLYPGRSLDLELAITIPKGWSPPEQDWVGQALITRARNPEATLRERGTAAMGLWERAIREGRPDLAATEAQLRELITEFRDPAARPDVAAGLRWVALTLEYIINNRVAVCNEWPDVDEPWFGRVEDVANDLESSDVPEHLRTGTKNLFMHMILQNAGVHRRQAIETVVTSGWSEPVADALGRLLRSETEESWLRIRAIFALGFLQRPDYSVEADLTSACLRAHAQLDLNKGMPPRAHVTEMHAALFAAGDCFGAVGAEDRAKSIRDSLREILTGLATAQGERAEILYRAARAAAYFLVFSAQPREGEDKDFSQELLERFSTYPDPVTSQLSRWALKFRFADDGSVRPLLAAVQLPLTADLP
jgi:hypothetical protein